MGLRKIQTKRHFSEEEGKRTEKIEEALADKRCHGAGLQNETLGG